jgi:S1-C subfamily serine protease
LRSITANEIGEYSVDDAPPGLLEITAELRGAGEATMKARVERRVDERPVEVPTLDLAPVRRLKVRVTDERGRAVPYAWVATAPVAPFQERPASNSGILTTDQQGFVELELAASERELFAAEAARAFGSVSVVEARDGDEVALLVDQVDLAPPDASATVRIAVGLVDGRLRILAVAPGGEEAERLRIGDVIQAIDEKEPQSVTEARELLSGLPGSSLELRVERGRRELSVPLERRTFTRSPVSAQLR